MKQTRTNLHREEGERRKAQRTPWRPTHQGARIATEASLHLAIEMKQLISYCLYAYENVASSQGDQRSS